MNVNPNNNQLLRNISNKLLLNSSLLEPPGLFNGKMGNILFFFHYARYTGNALYENFAGELLDEVLEDIHDELPICFADGLCGIGWGVEYLIQKGFVEGNADEILKEIDRKVMERDPRRITDYSFETGLEGVSWYVLCRLGSVNEVGNFDSLYVKELKSTGYISWQSSKQDSYQAVLSRIIENSAESSLSWRYGLKFILHNIL